MEEEEFVALRARADAEFPGHVVLHQKRWEDDAGRSVFDLHIRTADGCVRLVRGVGDAPAASEEITAARGVTPAELEMSRVGKQIFVARVAKRSAAYVEACDDDRLEALFHGCMEALLLEEELRGGQPVAIGDAPDVAPEG